MGRAGGAGGQAGARAGGIGEEARHHGERWAGEVQGTAKGHARGAGRSDGTRARPRGGRVGQPRAAEGGRAGRRKGAKEGRAGGLWAWERRCGLMEARPRLTPEEVERFAQVCSDLTRAVGTGPEHAVRALRAKLEGRAAAHLDPSRVRTVFEGHVIPGHLAFLEAVASGGAPGACEALPLQTGSVCGAYTSTTEGELWEALWDDTMRAGLSCTTGSATPTRCAA